MTRSVFVLVVEKHLFDSEYVINVWIGRVFLRIERIAVILLCAVAGGEVFVAVRILLSWTVPVVATFVIW